MRFLSIPLAPEEQMEKDELNKTLMGRAYWQMIDVWLFCVLKRRGINTISQKAWSVRDNDIVFGPLPENSEIV